MPGSGFTLPLRNPVPCAICLPTACEIDTDAPSLTSVAGASKAVQFTVTGTTTVTPASRSGCPRRMVIAAPAGAGAAAADATTASAMSRLVMGPHPFGAARGFRRAADAMPGGARRHRTSARSCGPGAPDLFHPVEGAADRALPARVPALALLGIHPRLPA